MKSFLSSKKKIIRAFIKDFLLKMKTTHKKKKIKVIIFSKIKLKMISFLSKLSNLKKLSNF